MSESQSRGNGTGIPVCHSTHDPTSFSWTSTLLCPGNERIVIFPFLLLCNHRMIRSLICSLLIGALMAVKAAAGEEFREELTLRPLPDGKVAAHFSFSTLLRGAVPRVPSSLGTDDTCTSHFTLREVTPGWADRGCLASLCSCSCLVGAFSQHSIIASFRWHLARYYASTQFRNSI
jgi:hypothetical protein